MISISALLLNINAMYEYLSCRSVSSPRNEPLSNKQLRVHLHFFVVLLCRRHEPWPLGFYVTSPPPKQRRCTGRDCGINATHLHQTNSTKTISSQQEEEQGGRERDGLKSKRAAKVFLTPFELHTRFSRQTTSNSCRITLAAVKKG